VTSIVKVAYDVNIHYETMKSFLCSSPFKLCRTWWFLSSVKWYRV